MVLPGLALGGRLTMYSLKNRVRSQKDLEMNPGPPTFYLCHLWQVPSPLRASAVSSPYSTPPIRLERLIQSMNELGSSLIVVPTTY